MEKMKQSSSQKSGSDKCSGGIQIEFSNFFHEQILRQITPEIDCF